MERACRTGALLANALCRGRIVSIDGRQPYAEVNGLVKMCFGQLFDAAGITFFHPLQNETIGRYQF